VDPIRLRRRKNGRILEWEQMNTSGINNGIKYEAHEGTDAKHPTKVLSSAPGSAGLEDQGRQKETIVGGRPD